VGHSQFMQKPYTLAHVENPSPELPLVVTVVAALQLPRSGRWRRSATFRQFKVYDALVGTLIA
jgi:hypothetical protein